MKDDQPDESRAELPNWKPVYDALRHDATWLCAKWQEYRKLYAHSPERIALLNGTAAFFFGVLQDVLWDDVILGLARITDVPGSGHRRNLTVRQLPLMVSDLGLLADLQGKVDAAVAKCACIKPWRDKRLAHSDLRVAIEAEAEYLPGISRQHVEEALEAVGAVLNCVERYFLGTENNYGVFLAHSDAEDLVQYLEIGARAEAQRRERLRQGCPLPEDFETPGGGAG